MRTARITYTAPVMRIELACRANSRDTASVIRLRTHASKPHRSFSKSISILFVVILSLAQIAGQLGAAFAAAATVECCCGEHLADQDCGCPDCPGAVFASAHDDDAQGGDMIRACGQEGDEASASSTSGDWNVGNGIAATQRLVCNYAPPHTADRPFSTDPRPSRAPS